MASRALDARQLRMECRCSANLYICEWGGEEKELLCLTLVPKNLHDACFANNNARRKQNMIHTSSVIRALQAHFLYNGIVAFD